MAKPTKKVEVKFFKNGATGHASLIIEADSKRILIDPGSSEGPDKDKLMQFYDVDNLHAIVLTHYHGDHTNLLEPILQTGKFNGVIVCHKVTADIVCAPFSGIKARDQFRTIEYDSSLQFLDDFKVTLFEAGHVLGSAILYFEFPGKTVVVTGDLGAGFLPIVREPVSAFPRGRTVDLLVVDAKQAGKPREIDYRFHPLGDIIYRKLQDSFYFDDGNVLIHTPFLQIPVLLYCLNYIFSNPAYVDLQTKIANVYLEPNPATEKLLEIFHTYRYLIDDRDKEYVIRDGDFFGFDRLIKQLPENQQIFRSIIITIKNSKFIKLFRQYRESPKHDVLLLNHNIYSVLGANNIKLIDRNCNIQIKRLPNLHYHPDVDELINWCRKIKDSVGVNCFVFYHYKNLEAAKQLRNQFRDAIGGRAFLAHSLNNDMIAA